MDKLKMHSPSLTQENIARIRDLFPGCVTEAKAEDGSVKLAVDFDQLRQELSESIVEGPQERYQLNWPGKREALLTANAPIAKTLRPCREESVDFDTTKNLFIEGDNLDALKLLQETYLGKVRMIYIDPPYNTGNDFIYDDDFAEDIDSYFERSNQLDANGGQLVANLEASGRFHSDWLSMIYSRIKLGRNLLREDGLMFISIGDDEQASLKKLCDEVFGSQNFLGCACRVSKKANNQGEFWAPNFDYVLSYAKNKEACPGFFGGVNYDAYDQIDTDGPRAGEKYQLVRLYMTSLDPMRGCTNQRYYIEAPDGTLLIPPGNIFPELKEEGASIPPETGEDKVWRWGKDTFFAEKHRIVVKKVRSSNLVDSNGNEVKWNVFTKTYLNDVIANSTAKPNSLIEDHINQNSSHELGQLGIPFSFAKPSSLIRFLCEISKVGSDDVVMDFFAGSGSTAHAVMDLNATTNSNIRFVLVQLPEALSFEDKNHKSGYIFCQKNELPTTIAELAKERIRRAGKKLKNDNKEKTDIEMLDVGFRTLKIDTSNMADVYYSPDSLNNTELDLFVDNIKSDRTPEDLLFQVMLDWGVDLALPISKQSIQGKDVFFVDGNSLVACFDASGSIDEAFVKELAKHEPLRVVFRDAGFKDSSVKINVEQIFKLLSPITEVKCI
ncbi:MAG: site-specific DNA-methyltransferase [Oleibacter sp.]|nr:site-specific DNA-methyltransferase [Thalassolituus sp.]